MNKEKVALLIGWFVVFIMAGTFLRIFINTYSYEDKILNINVNIDLSGWEGKYELGAIFVSLPFAVYFFVKSMLGIIELDKGGGNE